MYERPTYCTSSLMHGEAKYTLSSSFPNSLSFRSFHFRLTIPDQVKLENNNSTKDFFLFISICISVSVDINQS